MSLIEPGRIPGADIHPEQVRAASADYTRSASAIRDGGADVLRAWQKLPSSFEATGTAHLYSVMDLVGTNTRTAGDGLTKVGAALSAYADALDAITARFDALRAEATSFAAEATHFGTKVELVSSGYTLGIPTPSLVTSWDQDPGMNDRNDALIRAVAAVEADWLDAQQRCASAIRAAAGLGPALASEVAAAERQLRSDDVQGDWGATAGRKESCSEKISTFGTHFVWDGVIVGFGGGLLQSLGALTGTWDGQRFLPVTWADHLVHGDWSALADDWQHHQDVENAAGLGLLHVVSGLVRPPGLGVGEVEALLGSPAAGWMPSWLRNGVRDWNREDGTAVYGMVGGLVGLNVPQRWWDGSAWNAGDVFKNWVDNPGGTFGESAANIATFFIPGVGEAAGGTKAAVEAAGAGADASRLVRGAEVGDSALAALKALDRDALKALNDHLPAGDVDRLFRELQKPAPDLSGFELRLPDAAGDLGHLPDGAPSVGHDAPSVHDAPAAPGSAAPHDAPPAGAQGPLHGDPAAHPQDAPSQPGHDPQGDHAPSDHAPAEPAPASGDPAGQQPAPAAPPKYVPQPVVYGDHAHPMSDGTPKWDPGTKNSNELGVYGERLTAADLQSKGYEILAEEPQINVPGSSLWFKPDFLALDTTTGDLVLVESKMGDGADFTTNQHAGYSQFDQGGHALEGRTVRLDDRLHDLLESKYGLDTDVIARVETYRWNVDVVPDADLLRAAGLR